MLKNWLKLHSSGGILSFADFRSHNFFPVEVLRQLPDSLTDTAIINFLSRKDNFPGSNVSSHYGGMLTQERLLFHIMKNRSPRKSFLFLQPHTLQTIQMEQLVKNRWNALRRAHTHFAWDLVLQKKNKQIQEKIYITIYYYSDYNITEL